MGAFVDFISRGIAVCMRNGFPLLVFCHVIVVHVTELTSEDYIFCIDIWVGILDSISYLSRRYVVLVISLSVGYHMSIFNWFPK